MSGQASDGEERLVFGVPAKSIVDALRGTGMAEADVIAVLGRGIARADKDTGAITVAETPPFIFQTHVAEVAPQCALTFERGFVHPDFIDGVTVVQAGSTQEELGFNERFHRIERDLDEIATDLRTASNCMAQLRLELFGVVQELQTKITEIDSRLDTKGKEKDGKDTKEKDKEKEKEGKDKEKEGKDTKESKDKDGKEKDAKEFTKDGPKDGQKEFEDLIPGPSATGTPGPATGGDEGTERTFITLEERPEVGRAALADPDEER